MSQSRILVVDDDALHSELLIQLLSNLDKDYILFKANNGKIGVEIALEIIPDLIIMDWEMPVLNGIDAITHLKSDPKTKNIPVIVLTGLKNAPENLKIALDSGAVDFIRKPFDKIELKARVNSALIIANSWKTIIEQKDQILLQEKNRFQNELEFRSKELINSSLYISKTYKRTEKVLNQIKGLYPFLNRTGNKILDEIIKENSFDLNQSFWTDFELHFDEIFPGFFKSLQKMHPNLTQNEKKLCAFIRLNMSTKDIASITNLEQQSVNIARSRLRSKLKLDRDTNLFVYLSLIF